MTNSQFGEIYNHDSWAADYDANVADESHPIRTGYAACLQWVVDQAHVSAESIVADLGIGTGNLSLLLPRCQQLIGIDVSGKMMQVAAAKMPERTELSLEQADVLPWVRDAAPASLDALVSTYVIHHLTDDEKATFFQHCYDALTPGGRVAFGDLMFADRAAREAAMTKYRDRTDIADVYGSFVEEFYWFVDEAAEQMQAIGFDVVIQQFSELSWGIAAVKPVVE